MSNLLLFTSITGYGAITFFKDLDTGKTVARDSSEAKEFCEVGLPWYAIQRLKVIHPKTGTYVPITISSEGSEDLDYINFKKVMSDVCKETLEDTFGMSTGLHLPEWFILVSHNPIEIDVDKFLEFTKGIHDTPLTELFGI